MYELFYERFLSELWMFHWWEGLIEVSPRYWPANDPSFKPASVKGRRFHGG